MNEFNKTLTFVNELLYEPNHLTIKNIREESQNSDYGAGVFQLNSKSVRFRVAKITPNKVGQFVSFWEKDEANKNQAFSYDNATDLLVINTFNNTGDFGQFVFPKEVLLKQNILKTANTKGKMAIRVYPSWDTPTSKQAIATKKWQSPYFVKMEATTRLSIHELLKLYSF
ncbi:MepB family protein [Lysinibacillus pakistanensis]|uniref:MepB family protein n=1 Tax=Lysinibacillus pakistanensis TaxID=759811 RepID=A0AAX3WPI1_9BACI|nr:MepB family protein [Lysinibacillus pakistanensis]MDM5234135.1 MepB family protein [Lysinibacillus pakistanensis]WHY44735.1 MepB family protein [Lysinibacillus pakistanensis]WHY49741.1 MepB family protein [Lysinibacillus pakistanensis]